MSDIRIRVLGPITAERNGRELPLTKPRTREVLGILVAARGYVVPTSTLIGDLWEDDPPHGAAGAVQTFIGELRRALDPDRPRNAPSAGVVTLGGGYRLRVSEPFVDAWSVRRAERAAAAQPPERADVILTEALAEWRGTAFDEFAERPWAAAERTQLATLRSRLVLRLGEAHIAAGRPGGAVELLDPFVVEQPWNEEAWRLLALALYRDGRRHHAGAVLAQAQRRLTLGFEGAASADTVILAERMRLEDPALDAPPGLRLTAEALGRANSRAQLEASAAMLTSLALSGDITVARVQRLAAIRAAEEFGDAQLTAQVIGGFEAPGIWTRSDDEEHAAAIVAAAARALARLPAERSHRLRARLLATIAMESRGTADRVAEVLEAEELVGIGADDEFLDCLVACSRFMQMFVRTGLAKERGRIGSRIEGISERTEWSTFEITGLLIRMQALCARDDIDRARRDADRIDDLARSRSRALATVFTRWFRWTFLGEGTRPEATGQMPGFEEGIAALDDVTRALRFGEPLPEDGDLGPHEPWVRPLLLARADAHDDAHEALRTAPDPPKGLLLEVYWCLLAEAAIELEDTAAVERCIDALRPARFERAAGSGVIDLGPVSSYLARLRAVLPPDAAVEEDEPEWPDSEPW
ncbi:BTAD domain-containing protein [Labedella populi]|uniref:BTAD domain-containing protein n=1 Tax=Labedella populi TaxID=2498850 RepID=A0A3S4E735_9MICO|nr:BTAD domain-containing putative transcriptional regulator [Labedella populi]RWZ67831.1 BTAD domain-containing protein [Labedella populi]